VGFVVATSAQEPVTKSALHSMVDTERAFAKASEEKGTRDSFLMFIAEDGILFRPTAVMGKKWLQEHPVPLSEKRPLLAWQPIFADMAAAGDMGYTFGPWEFKQDIKDQKPVAFGHFATVWKKQKDGTWKFAIDLGISHPQSATPSISWEPPPPAAKAIPLAPRVSVTLSREALITRDREFSKESANHGSLAAFTKYAADDVRLFRNDHLPFVGKSAIAEALRVKEGVLTWQPLFADASSSGDLGYTHGTYKVKTDRVLTAKGNYMRFWKKLDGVWKVVLDVADPLPLEKKGQ
jgi:ketosteroid isomerase-like protein